MQITTYPTSPDPYAPIEKRSLLTHDGMRSKGFTVRRREASAPAGWAECGVVSADYMLVPNTDVRDLLHEVAERTGLRFKPDKLFFDGKRYVYGLVARDERLVEVKPGDPVALGLMARNSYDGSERLSISAYVHRLVCRNGLLAPTLFRRIAVKHERRNAGWEGEVERVMASLRPAEQGVARFAEAARVLSDSRVTPGRLRDLRAGPLAKLPVTLWGRSVDQMLLREEHTLWGVLNAVTALTWHSERMTASDFQHNELTVSALVDHALASN